MPVPSARRFSGLWLCTLPDFKGKTRPKFDDVALLFLTDANRELHKIFFRNELDDPIPAQPLPTTYAFAYDIKILGKAMLVHPIGEPPSATFHRPWRRGADGALELLFGRTWEKYWPSTFAALRRRHFNMSYVRDYLNRVKATGWHYTPRPSMPDPA